MHSRSFIWFLLCFLMFTLVCNVSVFAWKRSEKFLQSYFLYKCCFGTRLQSWVSFWEHTCHNIPHLNKSHPRHKLKKYEGARPGWVALVVCCHHLQETSFHRSHKLIHIQLFVFTDINICVCVNFVCFWHNLVCIWHLRIGLLCTHLKCVFRKLYFRSLTWQGFFNACKE